MYYFINLPIYIYNIMINLILKSRVITQLIRYTMYTIVYTNLDII